MLDRTPYSPVAFEPLESRQMLAGDLSVAVGTVANPFDAKAKFDRLEVGVTVVNAGTLTYGGGGKVLLFLSADQTLDDHDAPFASLNLPKIKGPGTAATLQFKGPEPKPFNPPNGGVALDAGNYFVIAKLVLNDASYDTNPANDVASSASASCDLDFGFGDINVRPHELTVTLPDGTTATFKLKGGGFAALTRDADGRSIVSVTDTNAKSELLIFGNDKKRMTTLNGLSILSPIGSVTASRIIFTGNVIFENPVSFVTFGGFRGGTMLLRGTTAIPALDLGEVVNSSINSAVGLRRLNVRAWLDTNAAADSIRAPFIHDLHADREFQAGLTLTNATSKLLAIDSVKIGKELTGVWNLNFGLAVVDAGSVGTAFRATVRGAIELFKTGGNMSGTLACGPVTKLYVGGNLLGATILVGTQLGTDVLLGGRGANADSFFASPLKEVFIKGAMNNSIITAGIRSTDEVILNGDDTFVTSGESPITTITIGKQMQNSFIAAPSLPAKAKVNTRTVTTASDSRFISSLPRTV